ncbi:MAG: glycosyltransferase family 4 protein [Bacteroidales bacterium]|nr:glycosyltransferase family 4 protein [Bacteroidales bacterium]
MDFLLIHNSYGKYSGEEAVVDSQFKLLKSYGHSVYRYERSSAEIPSMTLGNVRAFFSGIYNPVSCQRVKKLLVEVKPDIVNIHNLYPFISPAILPVIKKAGVPIVMTVHNYRLICPNGLFMNNGQVCEKCKGGREYNCLLNNCEQNILKSLGYFLRNWFARVKQYYHDNVDFFVCLTEFQRQVLISAGFNGSKIVVIPNMTELSVESLSIKKQDGYVFYAGRISPEKGISVLLAAAKCLSNIKFKLAGSGSDDYIKSLILPSNVEMLGMLNKTRLQTAYKEANIFVLASTCYEGFPMVFPEAMIANLPIIAPKMAGYPEIVKDHKNGLLFEPSNAEDLAQKIKYLWDNPDIAQKMGKAGQKNALHEYSPEKYYERLMGIYKQIIVKYKQHL